MRVCCMSDIHNKLGLMNPPPADVLVIAGDLTQNGTLYEISLFNDDLGKIRNNYKEIFVVGGNHDFYLYNYAEVADQAITNGKYMEDEKVTFRGKKFYFSPWIPPIGGWAFEYPNDHIARDLWGRIPTKLDLLVTHGPPAGVGFLEIADNSYVKGPCGCPILSDALVRAKPKNHVFGHIHEGYGSLERGGINFYNVSSRKRDYHTINPAVVIDI